MTGVVNESVSLSCELYGYVNDGVGITWQFGNNVEQMMNDSVYTITKKSGDHMIQNGEDSPRPSVRSFLTIEMLTSNETGTYICSGGGKSQILNLDIGISKPYIKHIL